MKNRTFTSNDQIAFAELSGDYNPLHIDVVAARRLLFGSTVVHGIHALLWGLDCCFEDRDESLEIREIKAVFSRAIIVDEKVTLSVESDNDGCFSIEILDGGLRLAVLEVHLGKSAQRNYDHLAPGFPKRIEPRDLSDSEIETDSGVLDLSLNVEAATKMFPNLIRCLSPTQVAILLASTRLVGVRCPGLHSIYSEIDLSKTTRNESSAMQYEVNKFDRRFGLVLLNVVGPEMTGTIKAFRRPSHQKQADYLTLKKQVNSDEFADQRALIIGGSRGLGEVAAKLLAGGGADVQITYYQGKEDARRIVSDIISVGGVASSLYFDVLNPKNDYIDTYMNDGVPTHLYYFATSFIARGKRNFSVTLFNKFCAHYVAGFANTLHQVSGFGIRNAFYPSTVYIDEPPNNMGEYVAAKIAGEMLCTSLEKNHHRMQIYRPRLPRMATDQTASIIPVSSQDPAKVMIKELRFFRDSSI